MLFRVAATTIGTIVPEVCAAIYTSFKDDHLSVGANCLLVNVFYYIRLNNKLLYEIWLRIYYNEML